MENKKNIEAIILNYRRGELTARCIESLVDQVTRIWVVDNSQDENQSKVLAENIATLPAVQQGFNVEILNSGENLGFAKGVQVGIDHALSNDEHKLILLINNDAIASAGMVDQMVSEMNKYGKASLIAPRETTEGAMPSMLWYHRLFALLLTRPIPGSFPYLTGACLLVPTTLVQPFLFDPDFFMYGEDVELSWRLAQSGVALLNSDVKYEHAGNATSRHGSLFYEYHVARGHILLAHKLARGPLDRVILLLGRAISLPLRALTRSIRYRKLTPLNALILALMRKQPPHPIA
ncbi:MAG: glycosyltransferase family 2 protein [Desulfoprunum sp.]|jgi:hypothetical protein